MMDIKFRGKIIDAHKWVYGNLIQNNDMTFITEKEEYSNVGYCYDCNRPYNEQYEIDTKTVGQYTGLKDKNGKEIYEGDIVQTKRASNIKGHVTMYNGCWCICHYYTYYKLFYSFADAQPIEVIGNVYENSELLK